MVTLIVIAEHSKERRLAKYYPGKWLSATHKLGLSAVLYNVFSNNKSTVIITIKKLSNLIGYQHDQLPWFQP